jgi:DNA-binding beta-propeller fold protein YncE
VVDAGGNSLVEVAANGRISFVTTFPSTPAPAPWILAEPVPTKVRRGPDGALYVSTLSGVPFVDGSAAIYRVVPGQAPQLHAGGFKMINDFDFGPDGSIFVLQFATAPLFLGGPGALVRVAHDGTRSTLTTELFQPTGVIVGPDGSVYVSNKGTLPAEGEVLRIRF